MKNIKALFSIWLEGSITYALDESIDWAALLIAIKVWKFSLGLNLDFLSGFLPTVDRPKKVLIAGFFPVDSGVYILLWSSFQPKAEAKFLYSLTLRPVNVLNSRFKTHYHCLTNIYHRNLSDAHVFWEETD